MNNQPQQEFWEAVRKLTQTLNKIAAISNTYVKMFEGLAAESTEAQRTPSTQLQKGV